MEDAVKLLALCASVGLFAFQVYILFDDLAHNTVRILVMP